MRSLVVGLLATLSLGARGARLRRERGHARATSPATASTSASPRPRRRWTAGRPQSPFLAVGIYISGDSRACRSQPNLTPTWVGTQVRQAAGGCCRSRSARRPRASRASRATSDDFTISPRRAPPAATPPPARRAPPRPTRTPPTRRRTASAPAARSGTTSRASTSTNTDCRESALAFVSRVGAALKELGYVAGFYSSASSGIKMLDDARVKRPGQFALPDRIWIARWDGVGEHLDDVHPRGRVASRRPDEAVPGRPQRDLGRRHDQHRQQLPRPRRAAPVPRRGATATGVRRRATGKYPGAQPATAAASRPRPSRRCSACSRSRAATPARSTAPTTAATHRRRQRLAGGARRSRATRHLETPELDRAARRRRADRAQARLGRRRRSAACSGRSTRAGAAQLRATGVFDAEDRGRAAGLPVAVDSRSPGSPARPGRQRVGQRQPLTDAGWHDRTVTRLCKLAKVSLLADVSTERGQRMRPAEPGQAGGPTSSATPVSAATATTPEPRRPRAVRRSSQRHGALAAPGGAGDAQAPGVAEQARAARRTARRAEVANGGTAAARPSSEPAEATSAGRWRRSTVARQ